MPYDPQRHHRRSIRLKGYDYRQAGAYFVTIVVQGRECLLGQVVDGEMQLNAAGRMVCSTWCQLPEYYARVQLDAFVVMPNHIHGIIVLTQNELVCPAPRASELSLPDVVHRFKSLTTLRYIRGVNEEGWQPFIGRLWQRNYYEHIVRNNRDLEAIREYIALNPQRWATDEENPENARHL